MFLPNSRLLSNLAAQTVQKREQKKSLASRHLAPQPLELLGNVSHDEDSALAAPRMQPAHYELSGSDFNVPTCFQKYFIFGKHIGSGAYGVVNLVIDKQSGQELAVKLLPKVRGKLSKEKTLRKVRKEIELLARVQECGSVVHLHGVYESECHIYIVMELCLGGDLERILEDRGPFSERQTAAVLYECLKVISTCHTNGMTHGDVKPANFMMRQRFKDPVAAIDSGALPGAWLKAIDFGCSQSVAADRMLTSRRGTPVYMAPEVFKREYGREADMWSLGMMLYQLLTGRFPWWSSLDECRNQSLDDVMAAVMTAPIPINYGPWLRMSKEGMSFLKHLLLRDPTQRLTASEALEHPWFKAQFGWTDEPAAAGDSGTGADDAGKPLGGSSSLGNNIVPIAPRCSLLHPRQTGQGHSSVHSATL